LYLKNLTLRGFKSFASSTTLHFEPGITCVVGPNGSGKSNVVDALAWVMGEQGAKSLRGGKMEDVIFAGTADRPPLGRAEVVLTIDNSDGALPSEYTEVTISRTMFRNGGSDYAINGQACRLLDVQELLGDSGIGREMHVIVGQGQLDAILAASPEDRRGFVEEAAGVLKHRKRKEKALRKLEATGANLTRLEDLLGEIRRQLKPLSRQAEVARRAAAVQAEVREARAHLLADDVTAARAALHREVAAAVGRGRFPLVLGGDHSLAIGTIAGMLRHKRSLGVIWFDAHADLNRADTSPSGNIHGMSLAISLGLGHPLLASIGGESSKVDPSKVVLVGARSIDPGERELIRELGIKVFSMHDIDRLGMTRVMEEAISLASNGTDGVHLSLDMDGLDPEEAPGVGTPVIGGMTYREGHLAMELLSEAGCVVSADVVEVNPILDHMNKTAKVAVELVASLLGERIL